MLRIEFTFDPQYDRKKEEYGPAEVQKFFGSLLLPYENFGYFQVNKEEGGQVFIPTFNLAKVETFTVQKD